MFYIDFFKNFNLYFYFEKLEFIKLIVWFYLVCGIVIEIGFI